LGARRITLPKSVKYALRIFFGNTAFRVFKRKFGYPVIH
jgi:hypothetical protein